MDEEGKGIDQGDFETREPTEAPTTEPEPVATETVTEVPEPTTMTAAPEPGGGEQLPTTSGTEAIVLAALLAVAVLAIACGGLLARRKITRRRW